MFLLSSAGPQALAFLGRNPGAAWRVLLYCLCGAFGQNCIFMAINSFGSLVNITITTTRKFFGVLLSVFVNKSALRPPQWLAVGLVFSGLGMQVALKRRGHAKHA